MIKHKRNIQIRNNKKKGEMIQVTSPLYIANILTAHKSVWYDPPLFDQNYTRLSGSQAHVNLLLY